MYDRVGLIMYDASISDSHDFLVVSFPVWLSHFVFEKMLRGYSRIKDV